MNPETPQTPKRRGMPLWTALVALLLLAVVVAAALGFFLYQARNAEAQLKRDVEKQKVREAQNEANAKKAAEDAKLAMARTRQEEVLAQARNATNVLERLLQEINQVNADATTLKTSQAGRLVALHPDLVAQARRLYEVDLPALAGTAETITRLEGVRRIEQQLLAALGTTYQPAAELPVTAQNAAVWGEQERRRVSNAQALMAGLVQESKIKVPPTALTDQSPNLAAAVEQLRQGEIAQHQRTVVYKTTDAKTEAANTQANAEAQRILQEASLQASNMLALVNEEKAKWEREQKLREAEQKRQDTQTKLDIDAKANEARNMELRQKASDPVVQNKLAPFITPGYWQTKVGGLAVEKKPLSFSQLQARGALNPTLAGLHALVEVASSPNDRVRPRWKMPAGWAKKEDQMEMVKNAQSLLVELGPVLVELKMLEP